MLVIRPSDVNEVIKRSLELLSLASPATIALYRQGNFWDDYVFDMLFNPKTDEHWHWLSGVMRDVRAKAARCLRTELVEKGKKKIADHRGNLSTG